MAKATQVLYRTKALKEYETHAKSMCEFHLRCPENTTIEKWYNEAIHRLMRARKSTGRACCYYSKKHGWSYYISGIL